MTKYGNTRTTYNGRLYDSKKEAARAEELDMLTRADDGVLSWVPQPEFELVVNDVLIGKYIADFSVQWKDGSVTYEDVKGVRTPLYKLKKKLVEALYGITITEK